MAPPHGTPTPPPTPAAYSVTAEGRENVPSTSSVMEADNVRSSTRAAEGAARSDDDGGGAVAEGGGGACCRKGLRGLAVQVCGRFRRARWRRSGNGRGSRRRGESSPRGLGPVLPQPSSGGTGPGRACGRGGGDGCGLPPPPPRLCLGTDGAGAPAGVCLCVCVYTCVSGRWHSRVAPVALC